MLIEDVLFNVVKKAQNTFMRGSDNKFYCETKNLDKVGKNELQISFKITDIITKKRILLIGYVQKNINKKNFLIYINILTRVNSKLTSSEIV